MADKKKYNYGGQAVIEGVMIRGRTSVVTAVRRPNGDVTTDVKPLPSITTSRMRRAPLLRGVVILIEAMVLGIKSLIYSANIAMEEEEEEIPTKAIWGMIASAVVLVVVLFFIAPLFLTKLANNYIPNTVVFHIIEGVIRLASFIGYLKVISLLFSQFLEEAGLVAGVAHGASGVSLYQNSIAIAVSPQFAHQEFVP